MADNELKLDELTKVRERHPLPPITPNLISPEERYQRQVKRLKSENELLKSKLNTMEKKLHINDTANIQGPSFISNNNFENLVTMDGIDDSHIISDPNSDNVNTSTYVANDFEQLKSQIKQTNVSAKRPHSAIQSEANASMNNAKRANTALNQQKKVKPPPIHIHSQTTKNTIALVKGLNIKSFEIKRVNKDKHSVIVENMVDYYKLKEILSEVKTKYFSYTPKDVKPKSLVLKGLSEEENLEELKAEIENVAEIKVINIVQLKSKRAAITNTKLPLYIVQFEPNATLNRIYNIKSINYQRITWEQLDKKRDIMQCKNCQRFNHSAANCNLDYRCVKCSEVHKPGECQIKRNMENSTIFCINCNKAGHPASYRGCPIYQQMLQKLKQKVSEKRQNIQIPRMFQSTQVNEENGSYADILKNRTNENMSIQNLATKVEKMAKVIQQQSEQIAQLLNIISKL